MLPLAEASAFSSLIRAKPAMLKTLITGGANYDDAAYPATWRLINSPRDTAETLTRSNFALIVNFAEALCGAKRLS
jgi:hypothetical protein